jgi:ferredoxin
MSRFGIRKKLKGLVDGDRGKRNIVTHSITYVLPDGSEKVLEAEDRYNVLMASEMLPSPISTGRRAGGPCPDGRCGLCRIRELDGTGLSSLSDMERDVMDAYAAGEPHEGRAREPGPPREADSRLACHTRIVGPGGRVGVLELMDFDGIRGDPTGT